MQESVKNTAYLLVKNGTINKYYSSKKLKLEVILS